MNKFNLTPKKKKNQMQYTTKINLTTSKKYKPSKPLNQNTKTTTTHSLTQKHCYPPLSQRKSERGERSKPSTRSEPTKSTNRPPSITTQNQPNTTCQNHHQSPPPQNNKPIELQSHFSYQIQSPKLTINKQTNRGIRCMARLGGVQLTQ